VEGGAHESRGSLLIEGDVRPGYAFPWAGALFTVAVPPQRAANLSSRHHLSFWTRGDGQAYALQLTAVSYGFLPVTKRFVAGAEWKEYTFDLHEFDGMEGYDLTGVQFSAGPTRGPFSFQIDDVRFR
jgi:hypothetical protein